MTGEGTLDAASFQGKVVGGVLELAGRAGVPALVVAAAVDSGVTGGAASVSLLDRFGPEASWGIPWDA